MFLTHEDSLGDNDRQFEWIMFVPLNSVQMVSSKTTCVMYLSSFIFLADVCGSINVIVDMS